ncbi:MAG: glycosyltransferase family 39 protein [Desulfobacteraceae bacterium]
MAMKDTDLFSTERYFYRIVSAMVVIKLAIAYWLPLTSDEAYFYLWGQFPDINYYDHPPVTGWIMSLFGLLGHHIFFSRLFAIITGLIIALGLYRLVHNTFNAPEKARLIALCYLAAPLHMLLVLITTDTPLILFTALSGFTLHAALKRRSDGMVLLSGAFWGLAVLSKYFAGLLLIAVFFALVLQRERHLLRYLVVWGLGALPFGLFHIWANYQNCWTNILFNVVNRNKNVSWEISGLGVFILLQIYLATPWLVYYLAKNVTALRRAVQKAENPFIYLFTIPILLLGLVALHHTGLHWALAFYPFLFPLLVHLPRRQIHRIAICSLVFSLVHVIPVMAVLALPVETFKEHAYYHDVVLCKYGDELYDKIKATYGDGLVPATNGYYTSGAMTYHSGRHFAVFLDYSKHGRQDDKLTDYKALDGRDFLILWTLPIDADYTPYFESVTLSEISLRYETFYVAVGRGFKFPVYRDRFLKKIDADWYTCPEWLPKGDCFFKEMYFED